MNKAKVYDIFFNQEKICFSKGYEIFEEVYKELKDKLYLKRKEEDYYGWVEVTITKTTKQEYLLEKLISRMEHVIEAYKSEDNKDFVDDLVYHLNEIKEEI